ncbi:aliphatic sulfonate ABC transporter (ATP-binding protein) [Candidatus Hydrogenisulfobacillus filiaventi]|uniref:Aliphatic sulfonate ABC transporter (ATP-binding protein) n=1 Tax=Candidatus Hydrogenisulfobacillus filiaventi TaxID=2707344 RepID=A0A6F8ZK90_9FIRM|nr:ABC transporter ATP-binding protein [Bacillota bacterium]CAB1130180.1 aliphatic sulfonate ABC transporter (ATP-binding protein) [Candidatus Hydrogenisulfobacillus filiaventi]
MIRLEQVSKVYPPAARGGRPLTALLEVDLEVPEGEVVTVVGPSGCGKTTLLHLIAGFEFPSRGRVLVGGRPVTGPGRDRAVVFQQPALYPWLTVAGNVGFGLRLQGRPDPARVAKWLDLVGLAGFGRHRPYQLSGGMQQRAAIARALITEPAILLMDEPLGALDAQTRLTMQQLLLDLWRYLRPTVLFITHDVDEALLLGDRVVVLTPRPGRVRLVERLPWGRERQAEQLLTDQTFLGMKRRLLTALRAPGPQTAGGAAVPPPRPME